MSGAPADRSVVDLLQAVTAICAANVRREDCPRPREQASERAFTFPPFSRAESSLSGRMSSHLMSRRECVHPEVD